MFTKLMMPLLSNKCPAEDRRLQGLQRGVWGGDLMGGGATLA